MFRRGPHVGGELAGLFQDGAHQVGCRLLVARQPGDLRQAGDGIEGEAHLGDRRLLGHVVSISSAGNRARGWSTPPRLATWGSPDGRNSFWLARSEEHTSELQPLMRSSYAAFCLQK